MDDLIVSEITALLLDICKETFAGLIGKHKLCKIKKTLKSKIHAEILSKYGNRVFYNDLDHFLTEKNVISNIIRNCFDISPFHYKSRYQTMTYYVQLFVENYPQHSRYHYEVRTILLRYFEVIYLALNNTNDEKIRAVCNTIKELSKELSDEFQNINLSLEKLHEKVDKLGEDSPKDTVRFLVDEYRKHLLCLYPRYPTGEYLERKIYSKSDGIKLSSLDVLLKEKQILLLGEAGYGKTYESIILLQKACTNKNTSRLIPVLISLQEYGLLYSDIISGIKYKLSAFCDGEIDSLVDQQLKAGNFLLIFDGVDDISHDSYRTKFYAEFSNFVAQYNDNYFFITSRFNRYHGELGEKEQFFLTALSEQTIREELQRDGIFVDIPHSYYALFANPFFLSVGKSILKQSVNHSLFNRSRLFEKLFQELYGGLNNRKQSSENIPLTYHDAQNILGNLAFSTFSKPSYSYIEFDQQLSQILEENKIRIISSFIGSGLFRIEDKVVFVHKLLKEYCAAYYIVHNFPLSDNLKLYTDLVGQDEWKEVFIFAGGIFKEPQKQDEFLDFVMEHNLALYIECVNAKSDLSETGYFDSSSRLLTQIYKTYRFIITKYFRPIEERFDPVQTSKRFNKISTKKIGIIGCLSEDKCHLSYWFDFVSDYESDVQCLNEQQCRDKYELFEKKALLERGNFVSHSINLRLSGFNEESGRKIAINLIKSRLKELIEKRLLIEDKYLLCERVTYCKNKVKELKPLNDLVELQSAIDRVINDSREKYPNLAGYVVDGVELFDLQEVVHYLNKDNTILSEFVLPGPDILYPSGNCCYTWDFYSMDQKEKRIILFFFYHEISYLNMVEYNFPNLKKHFQRYNDAPYQVVIEVDYNEDTPSRAFASGPSLQYHYIASPTGKIPVPIVYRTNKENFTDHEQIIKDIQKSYMKQGRKANRLTSTRTGFHFTLSSLGRGDGPLSDYVYRSIKESLEDVLGPLHK